MDEIERLSSFWKEEGNYIFLREDDNVLILPPNRVYKINKTAAVLMLPYLLWIIFAMFLMISIVRLNS